MTSVSPGGAGARRDPDERDDAESPSEHVRVAGAPFWAPVPSFSALVALAVLLAAAGLLLSRVDLALLALPLLIVAGYAWDAHPRRGESGGIEVDVDPTPTASVLSFVARILSPRGTETVALRIATLGGNHAELVITADTARELTGRVPVLHSGPQEIVRAEYRLFAPDGMFASEPQGPAVVRRVLPTPFAAIESLPLPRRLLGLTGTHESSRPGDGGEFRDIHPYAPGDRLRRIDWRTTARRGKFAGDLYVRRTAATADTTVFLVLDSRDDVGEQVAEWSRNLATEKGVGSLDIAREAASSIAAGYIRSGDRVGFQDLASQRRMIDSGGGSRHLERLMRAIELSQPSGPPTTRVRPPLVTPGALVYVLSTFLDSEAARMAGLWRGAGHRVIAIDILPAPRFDRATRAERLAHRIVMMERSDRIQALQAQGVDVVRWQDDGTDDTRRSRFRSLSRPSRGGR